MCGESRNYLKLVVNPLPSPVTPHHWRSCDDNNDGLAEFILTDKDDEIIAGEPGVAITYHELETRCRDGVNPLTSPYTNTTTYSQIVYARVEYPNCTGRNGLFYNRRTGAHCNSNSCDSGSDP